MFRKQLLGVIVILSLVVMGLPALAQDEPPALPVPPGRLIIGDDNGLFTVLADSAEKTYLVEEDDASCWLRDGTFSPDSAQVLYTRICGGTSPTDWHATDRTASVFILNLDDGSSTEVAPNEGEYQDYAGDWHPDGDQIVIYSNRANNRYNLFLIDLPDGEAIPLTDFDSDVARVSWDPSGRYLLYNRYIIADTQIRWEIRAFDTTNQSEINVAVGLTPNWSPDGQWIAYATEGDETDIYVMPAACIYDNNPCTPETSASNVTITPNVSEREPVWSPDQTQIAYLRDTNPEPTSEVWDVYRQEIRTGLQVNITSTSDIKDRLTAWEVSEDAEPADVTPLLPVVMRISSGTANLRERPTTASSIVGTVNNGQLVFIQGANTARDWYRITLPQDGSSAWLAAYANLAVPFVGDPTTVPEIPTE